MNSGTDIPEAIFPQRASTGTRVPRKQSAPCMISGSAEMGRLLSSSSVNTKCILLRFLDGNLRKQVVAFGRGRVCVAAAGSPCGRWNEAISQRARRVDRGFGFGEVAFADGDAVEG